MKTTTECRGTPAEARAQRRKCLHDLESLARELESKQPAGKCSASGAGEYMPGAKEGRTT